MDRDKIIIRVSIQGIVVNMILVAFKMLAGVMANSIAIILDAVNNLSDALSQIIMIIGTKLAGKAPDKKHPYGYGRIEYISSVVIAAIILTAGLSSLKESVIKIFHPDVVEYQAVSIIIIVASVVVKFILGGYVKKTGEKINAQALVASGTEAFMEAILSASTLVAAFANMFFGLNLEGILGSILSVFIIKAGAEILGETLSSIIGDRVDKELSLELKERIRTYAGVNGAYDLVLHNYGPSKMIGSVHVEVDDSMTANQIHMLSRRIMHDIRKEYGIILTVGIYASNTVEEAVVKLKSEIVKILQNYPEVMQMHGFYVDFDRKMIDFDMVVSFKAESANTVQKRVYEKLLEKYPEYQFSIAVDGDYSD